MGDNGNILDPKRTGFYSSQQIRTTDFAQGLDIPVEPDMIMEAASDYRWSFCTNTDGTARDP